MYVPLEHHFEQQLHVAHRLRRYGAGQRMSYAEASDAEVLAEAIVTNLGASVDPRPVEPGGAARAGAMLAELL